MSRYYKVRVIVKDMPEDQLQEIMETELGWETERCIEYKDTAEYVGVGSLYGGMSDENAHDQIVETIKEQIPNYKGKITTQFTYLEDLPFEEYSTEL